MRDQEQHPPAPDGTMSALSHLHSERVFRLCQLFVSSKYRCPEYAAWLGRGAPPPLDPSPDSEMAALHAIQDWLKADPGYTSPLTAEEQQELRELRRSLGDAVQARLRELENGRPAVPTRGYCLVPPNKLRWQGEVEVQQRLWHLLGLVLDADGKPLQFEEIQGSIHRNKPISNKTISNDIHKLNTHLLDIGFPWGVKPKSSHLVRKPEGP
jgi:hypothetical protein